MNLGQIFDKILKSMHESLGLGFSTSKPVADDLSQGELICLLV